MSETCLTKCSCVVHCVIGWREIDEGHAMSQEPNAGSSIMCVYDLTNKATGKLVIFQW